MKFLIKFTIILFITTNCLASQIRNLTILTEPNMVSVLTKLARIYSRNNVVAVSVNFDSSANLINEVESGEPADVFISAHPYWMSDLKQKGLIDIYNISYVASDQLVLVTLANNDKIPKILSRTDLDLTSCLNILDEEEKSLIVDNKESALGHYSLQILEKLDLKNIKVFSRLIEDKSSILNLLKNNSEAYALMFLSEAKNNKDLKIISRNSENDIFYYALVIAGDNMETAREFVKFLNSHNSKKILHNFN